MAVMIPETLKGNVTKGERILYNTLRKTLPDDYIVYYEPDIRGNKPDFVIIGPDIGIIVLEVKDYTRSKLLAANPDEWVILTDSGKKKVKSPLKQARDYMFKIMDILQKDKDLVNLEGKYLNKLKFPCGFGTVFTRLTQKNFIEDDLYSVVPPNLCFTKEEIDMDDENFSIENLMEKLFSMFVVPFQLKEPLSQEDINRIRYHLFPEVRIGAEKGKFTPYQDEILLSLHDIKVMDLHQEKLAKQLGDKNRLIRGVAGSGKTLILASRAKILAKQHPDWKILILCYNISLARNIHSMVEQMMNEPDDLFDLLEDRKEHNVIVRNFHQFLYQDLKIKEGQIPFYLEKLEKGEAILPNYDAILIDEGQDFESNWLKLVSKLLNPDTMSLLLVEDRSQNIYQSKRSYIQDTGLDFRGRSKILDINYRNTAEIVQYAWNFYKHFSKLENKLVMTEIDEEIIIPRSTKRKGPKPVFRSFDNFFKEAEFVAKQIEHLHKNRSIPYEEILILYRVKHTSKWPYMHIMIDKLKSLNIPYYWITEDETSKRSFSQNVKGVRICTIDSSKGLDFSAVFMVAMNEMPFNKEEEFEKEVSRAYIGMTRAKQILCITASGESVFTKYFKEAEETNENIVLNVKIGK